MKTKTENKQDEAPNASAERDCLPRLVGASRWVAMPEMTWPSVERWWGDLEWKLRHTKAELADHERMAIASVLSAYRQMVNDPQKQRNKVCKWIKEASANTD